MIGTRVVTDFPLCDQEILLRHLHMTAHQYVDRYKASQGQRERIRTAQAFRADDEKDHANV